MRPRCRTGGRRLALAIVGMAAAVASLAAERPETLSRKQWYLGRRRRRTRARSTPPAAGPSLVRLRRLSTRASTWAIPAKTSWRRLSQLRFGVDRRLILWRHGTFVAASLRSGRHNTIGLPALAPLARLVVAKVRPVTTVRSGHGTRRAPSAGPFRQGARVIEPQPRHARRPERPERRQATSRSRAAGGRVPVRHGALVVAPVGNGTDAPAKPWPWASYLAADPARARGRGLRTPGRRAELLEPRRPLRRPGRARGWTSSRSSRGR